MKVLILNYAKQLFEDEDKAVGDERSRMREYGKYLDRLFIVVHSLKRNHFKTIKISDNVTIIPSKGGNKLSSLYNLMKISSSLCSEHKIDIINVQDPFYMGTVGVYLKKKFKCKLVTAVLGSNVYSKDWLKESKLNYLKKVVGKWVLNHSNFIQVDGSKTERELKENGIPKEKIFKKVVIPNGLEEFRTGNGEKIRKKFLGIEFERILLFVGRIERQKNLKGLLNIMPDIIKSNPKILLLIIGEGREKNKSEKWAKKSRIKRNITFLGNIPFDSLSDYYAASDIFLLPSNYEGFARSLILAGVSGKAIVSTNVSGASDLIKNGDSGFIVDVGDMDSFKDRIVELLNNKDKLEEFGKNAEKNARNLLNYNRMVDSQIKFWQSVCSE